MASDRINLKRNSLRFRSLGFQAALFFGAIPGVEWIAKGIPLLPGDGSPHERDLNDLIAPVEVLKVYGSSEELMRKLEAVQQAANVSRDLPMDDGKRARIASCFNELAEHIGWLAKVARDAETLLSDKGWKFDPVKGKVPGRGKFRRKVKGQRGSDFLGEVAWAIFVAKYWDKGNTPPVRRKISQELSPYFERSKLSPLSGTPIYWAIRNRLEKLKNRKIDLL